MHVNDMDITFPHQLFINGQFVDSFSKRTYETIDPSNEKPICKVAKGSKEDIDLAVAAAQVRICFTKNLIELKH